MVTEICFSLKDDQFQKQINRSRLILVHILFSALFKSLFLLTNFEHSYCRLRCVIKFFRVQVEKVVKVSLIWKTASIKPQVSGDFRLNLLEPIGLSFIELVGLVDIYLFSSLSWVQKLNKCWPRIKFKVSSS